MPIEASMPEGDHFIVGFSCQPVIWITASVWWVVPSSYVIVPFGERVMSFLRRVTWPERRKSCGSEA